MIPSFVQIIESNAFHKCSNLELISFQEPPNLTTFILIFLNSRTIKLKLESLKILSNILEIIDYAFLNCFNLKLLSFLEQKN